MTRHEAEGVHLLSVGEFGHAVSVYLRAIRNDVVETGVTDHIVPLPATWPPAGINTLASWRPAPILCEVLQEVSYEQGVPFIPVVLDSTSLRVGPVVVPREGCCWSCWLQRVRQHCDWPDVHRTLSRHYDDNPQAGPEGFLEPFAALAAERLGDLIEALGRPNHLAGYVWEIDVMTCNVTEAIAIGVHDCPRCGLHRPQLTRSVDILQRDLGYLWYSQDRKGPAS